MIDFASLKKEHLQKYLRRALLAAAFLALCANAVSSWKAYRHEPLRDAASRSLMAAGSSWFYASGLAEPVPVFALKAATALGADPDAAVRFQGLLLLAALVLLTFLVLRPGYGETAASLAALFLAANPYLGYYAMVGSSQLFSLFFLVLFASSFHGEGRGSWALAGLAGGLACLSRLDAAWPLLLLAAFILAARRREFRLRDAALALGLAALLTAPYLAWQRAQYGSAAYAQELGLRRWANIDSFGYAPAAQVPQGPLGAGAFLLREGPAAAAARAFSGLGRALAFELPKVLYHKFLVVLVFLGAYASAAAGRYGLLFFLAAALLPVLPLASVAQVPSTGGIELRYYLGALWAMCALAGFGFSALMDWFEKSAAAWAAKKAAEFAAGPAGAKGKTGHGRK